MTRQQQLAILISLVALTACGGGGDTDSAAAPAPASTAPATLTVAAGTASVISCSDDSKNVAPSKNAAEYLTVSPAQPACRQAVLLTALHINSINLNSPAIVGFSGSPVPNLLEYSEYDLQPGTIGVNTTSRRFFTGLAWENASQTANPGELWWGRQGVGIDALHVATGQLTWVRQSFAIGKTNPNLAADFALGKVSPFPSSGAIEYTQIGATNATFSGGSGGSATRGPVPKVSLGTSAATLLINASKPINGYAKLTMEFDGQQLERTIPLQSNALPNSGVDLQKPNLLWSLRAASAIGASGQCLDFASFVSDSCYFPAVSPTSGQRRYQAQVHFYGSNADYAVLRFSMNVDSPPEKMTTDVTAEGLVVFKRVP